MTALERTNIESPIGSITLVLDGGTIVICEFSDREARVSRQLAKCYPGRPVTDIGAPAVIKAAFDAYFTGVRDALDTLPSAPKGTPFQERVWATLKRIPAGTAWSYADLAAAVGSHPRAVGGANGANPCALLHPCHRVIGADGSLTGYAGGIERKAWLLAHEEYQVKA
ncbi:methylated-DNA--[protein]-cysteine S-methyltransferase [Gimibacter soli]|uniref:methylated-DNA--[protein]-cysteine S-methyltransferase n=1 Tax=Gimibacter soli TaxID=3024400 RepID=A0AAE9XTH8_9PROT|nr:methylated-DNA--[protein]-cysteine S-methyltransferase [Gimibacter soli]WCL54005.1 methylated-DNA--[protein]-cysteine S-methyltransferase [Gimibacter soli]